MKKQSTYNIYFADFESLTGESKDFKDLGHTDIYLTYIEPLINENGLIHYNLNDFMSYILSLTESSLIYFHNLSFDGDFIIKWLIKNFNGEFVNPTTKPKKLKWFSIFANGNKIYNIKIHNIIYINRKKKKVNIEFRCTYNLFNTSIASLGKSLGLDKKQEIKELKAAGICNNEKEFYDLGGFNLPKNILHYFEKYIVKDVRIAKQSFINFEKEIHNNQELIYSKKFKQNCLNIRNELTIGRIVYKLSKNLIYNHFGKQMLRKYKVKGEMYDLMKHWYYGGFTQFNEDYQNKWLVDESVLCFDIVSSYPNQMTKLLPVGNLYSKPLPLWKNYLEYYEIEVESAIIKNKYYNFICLKNWKKITTERYVRTLFNFKCYYTKEEWEFLKKIYDFQGVKIKKWYAEAQYLLKPIIDILYHYKELGARTGNLAQKQTYKIAQNSLYGTQCMRKVFDSLAYVEEQDYLALKEAYKQDKELKLYFEDKEYLITGFKNEKIYNSDYYGVYVRNTKEKAFFSNILIGAQITSYARLQIWNAILAFGVDNWFYSDTDSIFVRKIKGWETKLDLTKAKLGAWEKEDYEFNKGKILGAKRYVFIQENENKIKFGFSGVDVEGGTFDWGNLFNDKEVLKDAQQIIKKDNYGIYFDFRDYNVKVGNH